jgi:hypothetical protein
MSKSGSAGCPIFFGHRRTLKIYAYGRKNAYVRGAAPGPGAGDRRSPYHYVLCHPWRIFKTYARDGITEGPKGLLRPASGPVAPRPALLLTGASGLVFSLAGLSLWVGFAVYGGF